MNHEPTSRPGANDTSAGGRFPVTRWSIVMRAANESADDLADLCSTYWFPLYAFVRYSGNSPENAEDITQGFFVKLLSTDFLKTASRERGKFRTFLLQSLKNHMRDEWDKRTALKRGGKLGPLSLDAMEAEARYETLQLADQDATPEAVFDREWARATLDEAIRRLRESYRGDQRILDRLLEDPLASEARFSYSELAAELGRSPGAVKQAAHEARKKFSALLEEVVGETVLDPLDQRDEIVHLFKALVAGDR